MEQEPVKRNGFIPGWLWALVALILVGLVVALFVYDQPPEPGKVLQYNLPPSVHKTPAGMIFQELPGFPLDLTSPSAMTFGTDGRLFVAGDGGVVVLGEDGKEIARLSFKEPPTCLAIAPKGSPADGRLLVGMRNHVEVFALNGVTEAAWSPLDEKGYITSMAAQTEGVYVADAGNRIVLFYGYDGIIRSRIGAEDKKQDIPGFIIPSPYFDLALDPSGVLWVVNPGRHGLESYRPNGELISSWYRMGMELSEFCGCCNPIHIAFRNDGTLVTAEKGLDRVKVLAQDNSLLGVVADLSPQKAHTAAAMGCTDEPPIADLAVDAQNRVYILDRVKKMVRVFEQQKSM